MDGDFDGLVSKSDIHQFVVAILKEEDKDINESKLNRVHKLLDFFKRGRVQLIDIE